jgi:hypothetical protein
MWGVASEEYLKQMVRGEGAKEMRLTRAQS